jgi:hypothetical protein
MTEIKTVCVVIRFFTDDTDMRKQRDRFGFINDQAVYFA